MTWTLTVARDAERNLRRVPSRDRRRLTSALLEMQNDRSPETWSSYELRLSVIGDVLVHI
jgi:mRNA-degrading endonuclease RelE of RelBE toxin-antitoxin system